MKLLCALLALALLVPATADAAKPRPCALRSGEKVVAKSKRAVVTTKGRRVTGCRRTTGQRHLLEITMDPELSVSHFVLAGDKLAFAEVWEDHSGGTRFVFRVIDTRRWSRDRSRTGPWEDHPFYESITLDALALSPRGWVASRWHRDYEEPDGPHSEEFVEMDTGSGRRLLDSGPVGSLLGPRFTTPTRVEWTHDGTPGSN